MTSEPTGAYVEILQPGTVWRFERDFLESNWTCLFGKGCKGILDVDATESNQGCCSLGAHFGDGPAGTAEAMNVDAYAAMLTPEQFQYHQLAHATAIASASPDGDGTDDSGGDGDVDGAHGIFGDRARTHTRVVDGACIFLNRPGFAGGEGCALHIAALECDESPTEWKPSVCWQLPLRVDWQELDADTEVATVRRWTRTDWGDHGRTMAWCCTERADGAEAYCGDEPVVDSMADSLTALAGAEVYVELRRRIRDSVPGTA
jgi:hypothetical protein